ncbi:MAG: sugar transferase [Anaerolineaceae bacterium]|jgi:lipopolysaccharide/colanic/teichoic acid biosynthesis glycosyltransferase|nr:MAG: sugar transferase [Anaerolineaceae bacterium]
MRWFPENVPTEKRIFDILVSFLLLLILSPVFICICALLWISEGWPVIFSQDRPGLHGKIFRLWKFRTMRELHDENGKILPDADRISPVGKFLRKTSLDELPELINVFIGEMSLVGPRPLLVAYLQRYSAQQARRHDVLPGITGWAQINGRNAISWQKKFELDVWYVDHWTFWLDLKILVLTVWKVLSGAGISQPGRATMDEFMGDEK